MPKLSRTLRPSYLTSCFLSPSQFFHSLFPCSCCIILHHTFTNHHLPFFFKLLSGSLSSLSASGCCHAAVIKVYLKAVQSIKSPGFHLSLCHLKHAHLSLHHTAYSLSPFIIKRLWGKLWLHIALASHLLNHHSAVSVDYSVWSDTSLLLVTYSVARVPSPGCHSTVMRGI